MVRRTASIVLGIALALQCSGAAGQEHAHHGAAKGAPAAELGASAAFGRDALWAVFKRGRHVMLSRSNDGGATWLEARTVNAQAEDIGADGDSRPKVAIGAQGEVYVTWTQPLSRPYTGNIRFARSVDGGKSFDAPVTVHADRQEITHRFDAITVTREGRIFIAWVDKRDAVLARGKDAYRGAAIYFAVSDDRGATFRGDFRAADHSCECCRIALVAQEDGSVLALWRHVFEPDVRDHAMARLHADGHADGFMRASFDDWHLDACPHHGPSLAQDSDGRLHAVWFSGAPGREGVHYGRLRAGGPEGERAVGGATAEHADIAASGRRVAIAWKEFDGTRSRLRALRSDDGGASWREVELGAADGPSAHPLVLAHGGGFRVFWNTRERPLLVIALP
jgi:hypothetical protein